MDRSGGILADRLWRCGLRLWETACPLHRAADRNPLFSGGLIGTPPACPLHRGPTPPACPLHPGPDRSPLSSWGLIGTPRGCPLHRGGRTCAPRGSAYVRTNVCRRTCVLTNVRAWGLIFAGGLAREAGLQLLSARSRRSKLTVTDEAFVFLQDQFHGFNYRASPFPSLCFEQLRTQHSLPAHGGLTSHDIWRTIALRTRDDDRPRRRWLPIAGQFHGDPLGSLGGHVAERRRHPLSPCACTLRLHAWQSRKTYVRTYVRTCALLPCVRTYMRSRDNVRYVRPRRACVLTRHHWHTCDVRAYVPDTTGIRGATFTPGKLVLYAPYVPTVRMNERIWPNWHTWYT